MDTQTRNKILLCAGLVVGFLLVLWGCMLAPAGVILPGNNLSGNTVAPTAAPENPATPLSALSVGNLVSGVTLYEYDARDGFVDDYTVLMPSSTRSVTSINKKWTGEDFYVFESYFHAEAEADYSFYFDTTGNVSVDFGGVKCGTELHCRLSEGYYALTVQAFGDYTVAIEFEGDRRLSISNFLYHGKPTAGGLTSLEFLRGVNKNLPADITVNLSSDLNALFPAETDLTSLIPTFNANGCTLTVNGTELVSGVTAADFSHSAVLTVTAPDGSKKEYESKMRVLDTGLPCVCISSFGKEPINSKTKYVDGAVQIVGNGASYGADLPATSCEAKIRGNYSAGLEKKPYTLKFTEPVAILDLTAEKTWVLVASHLDLSQIRNYIAYDLSAYYDGTEYAPRFRFVDVFVNGAYRGLYTMGDHIDISEAKLDLDTDTDEPDIGCILELEMPARAEGTRGYDYFVTPLGWCVAFKDPESDDLTSAQRSYIRDYFIKAENAIVSGVGYEDYIDVDSFIDWYIIETLFKNCDSDFSSSVYFHKDRGGKLMMGPVWDFDSGLGNHTGFPQLLQPDGWEPRWGTYLQNLMSYPEFREKLSARWKEKRYVLDGFNNLVDTTAALISRSYVENFKVYNNLRDGIAPVPSYVSDRKSLEGQTDFIKEWVGKRIVWLDAELAKKDY